MEWNPLKRWLQDRERASQEAEEKENPAQFLISSGQGSNQSSTFVATYRDAFQRYEAVNRGTSLIVNGCASLDFDVKDSVVDPIVPGVRQKQLHKLLNFRPNPYQSVQAFRTNIFTDFILEGNIFMYFDGAFLYHLPAANVQIITDSKTFVTKYQYNGFIDFTPDKVIHIQDLSSTSIYRGTSRLQSASGSIKKLGSMLGFQDSFFENGAIPGIVLETDNTLSAAFKQRTLATWRAKYNPKTGARTPLIIDNGLKVRSLNEINFKELDFATSVKDANTNILHALGVPPILLEGGNNANIAPNVRLMYLETVLPIIKKFVSAVERYFGFDVEAVTEHVSALQPELKDLASYYTTLVNGGIMTPAEARESLRLPKLEDEALAKIRVPANIAGSATNPDQGGAPKQDTQS